MEYKVAYTVPARPFVSPSARREVLIFLVPLTTLHKPTVYLHMLIYHSFLFICCMMYLLQVLFEILKQMSYYWQQNGENENGSVIR